MTRKKVTNVSVAGRTRYSWDAPAKGEPPYEVRGAYRQEGARGSWRRQVSREVDLEGSVAEVVAELTEWASTLEDSDVYKDFNWGDEPDVWWLRGWRDATPDEVVWVERALSLQVQEALSRDTKRVEDARRVLREAGKTL